MRKLLREDLAPERVVGYIRRLRLTKRRICHETIYQYVWRDKAAGGWLWFHLRQFPKQHRKRYSAYESRRRRLAGKRNIAERAKSIETRRTFGHWEIDTVFGKGSKDCIVTLIEHKSGYTLIGILR